MAHLFFIFTPLYKLSQYNTLIIILIIFFSNINNVIDIICLNVTIQIIGYPMYVFRVL